MILLKLILFTNKSKNQIMMIQKKILTVRVARISILQNKTKTVKVQRELLVASVVSEIKRKRRKVSMEVQSSSSLAVQ